MARCELRLLPGGLSASQEPSPPPPGNPFVEGALAGVLAAGALSLIGGALRRPPGVPLAALLLGEHPPDFGALGLGLLLQLASGTVLGGLFRLIARRLEPPD